MLRIARLDNFDLPIPESPLQAQPIVTEPTKLCCQVTKLELGS